MPYQQFCTRIIVRSIGDKSYPDCDNARGSRISTWFKINVWDLNEGGIELYWPRCGFADSYGHWIIPLNGAKASPGIRELNLYCVGRIPWRNVVEFDPRGDQFQCEPQILVRYADRGEPYDRFRFGYEEHGAFLELNPEAQVSAVSDLK